MMTNILFLLFFLFNFIFMFFFLFCFVLKTTIFINYNQKNPVSFEIIISSSSPSMDRSNNRNTRNWSRFENKNNSLFTIFNQSILLLIFLLLFFVDYYRYSFTWTPATHKHKHNYQSWSIYSCNPVPKKKLNNQKKKQRKNSLPFYLNFLLLLTPYVPSHIHNQHLFTFC